MDHKKLEKKLKRKLIQITQTFPECQLAISSTPSRYVFVGNGGLASGVTGKLLSSLIGEDLITDIHSMPDSDSAFVEFKDAIVSEQTVKKLNGRCVQELVKQHGLQMLVPDSLLKGPPFHFLMAFLSDLPVEMCGASLSRTNSVLPHGCHLLNDFISEKEEVDLLKFFSVNYERNHSSKHTTSGLLLERNTGGGIFQPLKDSSRFDGSNYVDSNNYPIPKEALSSSSINLKSLECTVAMTDVGDYESADGQHPSSEQELLPENYSQLKLRTVHHYGYEFLYGSNTVDPSRPLPGGLPSICDFLIQRMIATGLVEHHPDQLTVNEYQPGAGIPPHVDTHSAFKDGIELLTLGSQIVMQLQHPNGRKVDVLLQRRSLFVLTGESRYLWTHCIPARKSDIVSPSTPGFDFHGLHECSGHVILERQTRVSLTFRKIHCEPCECVFPELCDNHK